MAPVYCICTPTEWTNSPSTPARATSPSRSQAPTTKRWRSSATTSHVTCPPGPVSWTIASPGRAQHLGRQLQRPPATSTTTLRESCAGDLSFGSALTRESSGCARRSTRTRRSRPDPNVWQFPGTAVLHGVESAIHVLSPEMLVRVPSARISQTQGADQLPRSLVAPGLLGQAREQTTAAGGRSRTATGGPHW